MKLKIDSLQKELRNRDMMIIKLKNENYTNKQKFSQKKLTNNCSPINMNTCSTHKHKQTLNAIKNDKLK